MTLHYEAFSGTGGFLEEKGKLWASGNKYCQPLNSLLTISGLHSFKISYPFGLSIKQPAGFSVCGVAAGHRGVWHSCRVCVSARCVPLFLTDSGFSVIWFPAAFTPNRFLSSDSPAVYTLSRFSLSDSPADFLCTQFPLLSVFRAFTWCWMQPKASLINVFS